MRYQFEEYQLDTRRWELHQAGRPVPVRPKVLQVLAYLLEHHERVVAKGELLERLWPHQTIGDASLLSCIQEVRRAIGDNGRTPRLLRTVRGFGYRVVAAVEAQEDHARRAVLAALELRQGVQDAPALHAPLAGGTLALGLGLHSGLVVVGDLGPDLPRRATAVGAPFHVATRLQQQATPGAILLSTVTYQLVQAEVRAVPYGTLVLAEALGDRPLQSEVHTTMGQIHYQMGDYGRAVELLQQAVTCLPSELTPEYGNAPDALWVWPRPLPCTAPWTWPSGCRRRRRPWRRRREHDGL